MASTNPYTSTRICKDCGKVMTNVSNTKLYCPECAKKRHDEQTAAWWLAADRKGAGRFAHRR
jgi:transposase